MHKFSFFLFNLQLCWISLCSCCGLSLLPQLFRYIQKYQYRQLLSQCFSVHLSPAAFGIFLDLMRYQTEVWAACNSHKEWKTMLASNFIYWVSLARSLLMHQLLRILSLWTAPAKFHQLLRIDNLVSKLLCSRVLGQGIFSIEFPFLTIKMLQTQSVCSFSKLILDFPSLPAEFSALFFFPPKIFFFFWLM